MTIITGIRPLVICPTLNNDSVPVLITNGIPSCFEFFGQGLDRILSVDWFPRNPGSVKFQIRKPILIDQTRGTFIIEVIDNYLDSIDRKGRLAFTLVDRSVITFPVNTYGPVSATPLWTAPNQGLITG